MYSRLFSIESDIAQASSAISQARSNIATLDSAVGSLPGRLTAVRGRGYAVIGHLESDVEQLTRRWSEVAPTVKQALVTYVEPLTAQVNNLQSQTRSLRSQIDSGNLGYSQNMAGSLSMTASSMRAKASSEANKVNAPIRDLFSTVSDIDSNLRLAEETLNLFGQANFPLKEDECPVLAFEGKILTGDKSKGTLYFTNQRFVFEAKKEVVLEKKFFIVTKKKTERVAVIDQPIGAIQEINKGRVGFIAWTGIYIRFKPDSRQAEAQFDVEGGEADTIKTFFDYLITGEADKDIAKIKGTTTTAPASRQIVNCPRCHAPYTREVFKGQKTVKCEYCGTQIVIQ